MEKGGGEEHYFQIQQNNDNEERKDKNWLNTSVLFTILTICEFYKLGHVNVVHILLCIICVW